MQEKGRNGGRKERWKTKGTKSIQEERREKGEKEDTRDRGYTRERKAKRVTGEKVKERDGGELRRRCNKHKSSMPATKDHYDYARELRLHRTWGWQ